MDTVENRLKELILNKYKSLREFTLKIEMPYSTFDTILKRGVDKANIINILKICDELSISADKLANGIIEYNEKTNDNLSMEEKSLLDTFNKLNDLGRKEAHKRVSELTHISAYTSNKNKKLPNGALSLEEAREYLKSFSSAAYGGFNPDEMTDDQIIETATELKYQFETVTHKYKK